MSSKATFRFFAALFAAAALYHLAGCLALTHAISGARSRHAVFVIIDAAFACLLLLRPWWLVYAFIPLTLQSVYSHGWGVWKWWHTGGSSDWISLGVVIMMPVMLAALIVNAMHGGRAREAVTRSHGL